MIIKKAVEQVIDSGVKPVVLDAQRVVNFSNETEGIRTSLVIKSLELGVLTANQYRIVARRTEQGSRLVERNIEKLFYFYQALKKEFASAKFFTVSVYARALLNGVLLQMLEGFFRQYPYVDAGTICLELSADILFEDIFTYKKELDKVKQLGVKIALCEVGQEFCPLLRLGEIDYDLVFLDDYFISSLNDESKTNEINGVMSIINNRPTKIYASCVAQEIVPLLETIDADGYTFAQDETLENKEWRVGGKLEWT